MTPRERAAQAAEDAAAELVITEAVAKEREACAAEAERPECECTIAPCAHMIHGKAAAARIRARKS